MSCLLLSMIMAGSSWAELVNPKMSLDLRLELRRPHPDKEAPRSVMVVLDAGSLLSPARIAAFEKAGVVLERVRGRVARVGFFYSASVSRAGMEYLLAAPDVVALLPASPRKTPPLPFDSAFDGAMRPTEVRPLRPHRDGDGRRLTGSGVVFADLDSGVDVFHPSLFRDDGGYFAWTDADDDQQFDPGIDGLDLDDDGAISPSETLHSLGGDILDVYSGTATDTVSGFRPGRQWLYLDTNANGQRDAGPEFGEGTPAYGEPIFLADDVDEDDVLEVGEKLVRLATSKVRAVIRQYSGDVFERGRNLVDAPVHDAVLHGTAVAGILVGGSYERTQIQGIAPDAELVMVDDYPSLATDPQTPRLSQVAVMDMLQSYGARVFVHEYGTNVGYFGDGSDPWERLLDELSEEDLVQVTAVHNFAGYNGNAVVTVEAGSEVPMDVQLTDVYYALLSLRWREGGAADITATLTSPSGLTVTLGERLSRDGVFADSERDRSPAGTSMWLLQLVGFDGFDYIYLEDGIWTLRIANHADAPRVVHANLSDHTGYPYAIRFANGTTDDGTIAWPSTADSAISVGAYVWNTPHDGAQPGELAYYSGRGPRIDGVLGIDVVAPEDHYTAYYSTTAGAGQFCAFSGTSGALPVVAGVTALMLQADPGLTPALIKEQLWEHASRDDSTGPSPSNDWGYGKLSAYASTFAAEAQENQPPRIVVVTAGEARVGKKVELDASGSTDSEDPAAQLTYRWDFDYDGAWDLESVGDSRAEATFGQSGAQWIKVEVEDTAGFSARLLHRITVAAEDEGCRCSGAVPGPLSVLIPLGIVTAVRRRRRRLEE